jgi:uncharacterized SAM-binding protein YcdF (DUF218 family)
MEFPVKILASPAVIFVLLAFLLLMLHQFRPTAAKGGCLLLLLLLWGAGTKPLIDLLAAPLELQYQPFDASLNHIKPRHIWVLGCNHQDSDFLPLTSQLEPCSLARVSEGVRLWQQQPSALLHLSGHIQGKKTEHTEIARRYAVAMGVAAANIRLHARPFNTRQEIQTMLTVVKDDPTALVTSAMHMPRAMRWVQFYQQQSVGHTAADVVAVSQQSDNPQLNNQQIMAAPTDFTIRRAAEQLQSSHFIPSVTAISALGYVHYEYLGLALQQWQMAQAEPLPNTDADLPQPD